MLAPQYGAIADAEKIGPHLGPRGAVRLGHELERTAREVDVEVRGVGEQRRHGVEFVVREVEELDARQVEDAAHDDDGQVLELEVREIELAVVRERREELGDELVVLGLEDALHDGGVVARRCAVIDQDGGRL